MPARAREEAFSRATDATGAVAIDHHRLRDATGWKQIDTLGVPEITNMFFCPARAALFDHMLRRNSRRAHPRHTGGGHA